MGYITINPASVPVGQRVKMRVDLIGDVNTPAGKVALGADGVDEGYVGSANPMPVSLAASPLPSGASTSALQGTALTALGDILVAILAAAGLTDAQLRAAPLPVSGSVGVSGSVAVTGPVTDAQLRASAVPVSGPVTDAQLRAAALPVSGTVTATGPLTDAQLRASAVAVQGTVDVASMPAGLATLAGQSAIFGRLGDGSTRVVVDSGTLAVTGAFYQATQPVSVAGTVAVSGPLTDAQVRASALPVSGTFWQTTQPVSLASLPALAAGSAVIGHVIVDSGTLAVTGTFWQATQPVSIAGTVTVSGALTDAQLRAADVPVSGTFWQATQPVSGPVTDVQLRASAVPVSGTFYQVTQPVSIASLPALAAGSAVIGHVVVDSGTLAVTGTFYQATQPVSIAGTVTTTALTDAQLRASAVPVSGTFYQATQPVSIAASVAVTGTFWQGTQPVSGTVAFSNTTLGVTGPLTDTQLRATAVPISGTVTATGPLTDTQLRATAVPVSGTVAVTNASLTSIDGKMAALGQAAMAGSMPVVFASNQSALPVTVGVVTANPSTPSAVISGQAAMVTAGTQAVLAASTAVKSVVIKALSTNGGLIYVGPIGVTSANGHELVPGESIPIFIDNLASVFINGTLAGDKVSYIGNN